MATAVLQHTFENPGSSKLLGDLKDMHVIEFQTSDKPEELVETFMELHEAFQEEWEEYNNGASCSSAAEYHSHHLSIMEELVPELFDDLDEDDPAYEALEAYIDELEDEELEELMENQDLIRAMVEKVKMATEEQEEELREKAEELRELKETYEKLKLEKEYELPVVESVSGQSSRRPRWAHCLYINLLVPFVFFLLLNAYVHYSLDTLIQ